MIVIAPFMVLKVCVCGRGGGMHLQYYDHVCFHNYYELVRDSIME